MLSFELIKSLLMQHLKTITSVLFFLLGIGGLHAQETVPATGGDATGAGGTSSYTVGQVVYITNTGSSGSVAQGVQCYKISTITEIEVTEISLELTAYPNPTENFLTLNIGNYGNEHLSYQLYDIRGKLLDNKQVLSNNTCISMQYLPVSTYLLNVLDNNSIIKTFKIIKH
jgi:hypothetical protein